MISPIDGRKGPMPWPGGMNARDIEIMQWMDTQDRQRLH